LFLLYIISFPMIKCFHQIITH